MATCLRLLSIWILLSAFLTGCASYKTIKADEMAAIERRSRNRFWQKTCYVKSDRRYHYFRHSHMEWKPNAWNVLDEETEKLKVSRDELILTHNILEEAKAADAKEGVTVIFQKDRHADSWIGLSCSEYKSNIRIHVTQVGNRTEISMEDRGAEKK